MLPSCLVLSRFPSFGQHIKTYAAFRVNSLNIIYPTGFWCLSGYSVRKIMRLQVESG